MKKYIFLFSLSFGCFQLFAQSGVKKTPQTTPSTSPVTLNNITDSLSYSIGIMVANFYKQQGITQINDTLVNRAIQDEMKGDKTLLNEQQCNQIVMSYLEKAKAEKAAVAKKQGLAFLAENKTRPGVVTTASGLQYIVLKEGTGPKPTVTDKVKCDYEGKLIDGTVFDSSIKQGHPIEFAVNGVIRGWTEALQLMPVGSKYRLFIPSELAYGDQQMGPDIKPGSTLIFEVELLGIEK
ncbi:MAG TPA: peptidylprolyl isomerase [Chitinophagaceae bacterium]|jgi:FKBP-type peptidyl-prolyl cis-trans isomerase FklB|nr:peptidylprolyl isomerase [Chitinophagaceae bacterium]